MRRESFICPIWAGRNFVFVWKDRGDETVVDQSSSSSERETSDGREREREMELSGVRRPRILSAPWAEVRDGAWDERGVLRGIVGVKAEEVGERDEFDSVGDSRTGVKIVE